MFIPHARPAAALHERTDMLDMTSPATQHAMIWTWIGLQLAGQILLFLLLGTYIFSRRLKATRHPFVVNFVATWVLSTFPALLLLYAGQQEGPEPNFYLCLFNASLMSGVPPMEAVAFLAVMVQVWDMLRTTVEARTPSAKSKQTIFFLASPYIVFVAFSLATGIVGVRSPASVTRSQEKLYCAVGDHNIATFVWGFTALVVCLTLALQAWVCVILYRNWRTIRGAKVSSGELDTHLVFRAAAFTVYELFIVATSLIAIFMQDSIPPKFMEAIAPIGVFFILASQPDVFFSWFPCLRGPDTPPEMEPPTPSEIAERDRRVGGGPMSLIEALEDFRFPPQERDRTHSRVPSAYETTRATFSPRPGQHTRGPSALSSTSTASTVRPLRPGHASRESIASSSTEGSSFSSHTGSILANAPAPALRSWASADSLASVTGGGASPVPGTIVLTPSSARRPIVTQHAAHASVVPDLTGSVSGGILEMYDRQRGAMI